MSAAIDWHKLGPVAAVPPGEGRNFDVAGTAVAVFHTRDGQVFATEAACPHLNGPLADGLVDDGTVICPLHDRVYDLRDGRGLNTECSIRTYPVRLADGAIFVTVRPPGG